MKDAFVRGFWPPVAKQIKYHHCDPHPTPSLSSSYTYKLFIEKKKITYELHQIDNGHFAVLAVLQLSEFLVADQRPQFVQINCRAEVVVAVQMEITHTQLAEVTGMVFVHIDSVMVHATGITTTTGMLTVLS